MEQQILNQPLKSPIPQLPSEIIGVQPISPDEKTPLWKKWWLWIILFLFILAIFGIYFWYI